MAKEMLEEVELTQKTGKLTKSYGNQEDKISGYLNQKFNKKRKRDHSSSEISLGKSCPVNLHQST